MSQTDVPQREPAVFSEVVQAGELGFTVDWVAYFREFSRVNGDHPVLLNDNGRQKLLFRTGWAYSAKNHAGPEYPPPTDTKALGDLVRFYWTSRRGELLKIHEELTLALEKLQWIQRHRAVPLQVREVIWDDSSKKAVSHTGDIRFERIEERVERLKHLIDECDAQLDTLEQ